MAGFSLKGKRLYTGLDIEITFNPAPKSHRYKIKCIDTEGQPTIDALAEDMVSTQQDTVLGKSDVQVSITEHAIAALYAYEVGNYLIEVNAPEFPILDGSSRFFSEEIQKTGVVEQNAPKDYYIAGHKTKIKDKKAGSPLTILPDNKFSVDVPISLDPPMLSNQFTTLSDFDEFPTELMALRMFVLIYKMEMLLNHSLIKDSDSGNVVVIYDQGIPQESLDKLADMLSIPHKNVQESGYINNRPPIFGNKPIRHKLIDVVEDITLIGKPIHGCVVITYPGHKISNQLACMTHEDIEMNRMQTPVYDPNREPVMDINCIRELLPHRYPLLLVGKIIEIGGSYIVSVKDITTNEPLFQRRSPQEPVMPGVLQVEVMAQAGGLLVLNSVGEPEHYSTYFTKIDGVKFRQETVPDDTLVLRLKLLAPICCGISTMKGYVFISGKLASEAKFMAQIIKSK